MRRNQKLTKGRCRMLVRTAQMVAGRRIVWQAVDGDKSRVTSHVTFSAPSDSNLAFFKE